MRSFILSIFLLSLAHATQASASNECLVGANPGSGWDAICRSFADYWNQNLNGNSVLKVTNMPGAGAGIVLSHLSTKRGGDADVVMATGSGMVFRFATSHYQNLSKDDFSWLAAVARDHAVLAVKPDSKLRSLKDFIAQYQVDPSKVRAAGGTYGGIDHLRLLHILQNAGIKHFSKARFVPYEGGGGAAIVDLLGSRVDVVISDLSEVMTFLKAKKIRLLGVFSEAGLKPIPDVATAKEQGLNVVSPNWRGFLTSRHLESAKQALWHSKIKDMVDSTIWKNWCEKHGLESVWIEGQELDTLINHDVSRFKEISSMLPVGGNK